MSAKDAVTWLREQIEGDRWTASVKAIQHSWHIDIKAWATNGVGVVDERDQSVCVTIGEYAATHIARHDPQDVIADCEAKLRILDEHRLAYKNNDPDDDYSVGGYGGCDGDSGCITCHYLSQMHVKGCGICLTVRILATAYKHRDGYAERWDAGAG